MSRNEHSYSIKIIVPRRLYVHNIKLLHSLGCLIFTERHTYLFSDAGFWFHQELPRYCDGGVHLLQAEGGGEPETLQLQDQYTVEEKEVDG